MTEERKQYLTSISIEERAIRDVIGYQKMRIYNNKFFLSSRTLCKTVKGMKFSFDFAKREIREAKVVIKALKKQLPAPVKVLGYVTDFSVICSACGKETAGRYKYCNNCGQKLK